MENTLVISGHPDLENSYTNKTILQRLEGLENVNIRNLAEHATNFKFNIEKEQAALLEAKTIILQFPFYWYSVPAILKAWIDQVLSFNFAYGPEGDKLKGKNFILSFTVGGPEDAYQTLGYNHFPIAELVKPLQQTAYLTQMNYLSPVFTHGMIYIPGVYNSEEVVLGRANEHADRLIMLLSEIV